MISDQAFILHKKPYRDSSELIKVLTKTHGIMDMVSKGSRKPKSKMKGHMQHFLETHISYSGKSDLKTLIEVSQSGVLKPCKYKNHISMLYCNELLVLLKLQSDFHEDLYFKYRDTIKCLLMEHRVSPLLRRFEWFLSQYMGYALELPEIQQQSDWLNFDYTDGLVVDNNNKLCQASTYIKFVSNKVLNQSESTQINQFMRKLVDHMVNGQTIQCRQLL